MAQQRKTPAASAMKTQFKNFQGYQRNQMKQFQGYQGKEYKHFQAITAQRIRLPKRASRGSGELFAISEIRC